MRGRLALSLVLLAVLGVASAASAEPRACSVSRLEGAGVSVWHQGTWAEVASGALPGGAAKLRTGRATRVEIRCSDGLVLTVGVATEVNLEVLSGSEPTAEPVVLQLIRGIVGLVAPRAGRQGVEVRTPLAIAAVRSTEWLVEHDGAEGTAVFVRAGRVAVRSRAAAVTLGPGEGVTIAPDGGAGAVKTWGAARIERSTAALGLGWR